MVGQSDGRERKEKGKTQKAEGLNTKGAKGRKSRERRVIGWSEEGRRSRQGGRRGSL